MSISIPLALAIEGHCVADCGDGSSESSTIGASTWAVPDFSNPQRERELELERIRTREEEKARRQAQAGARQLEAQGQMQEVQRQKQLEWDRNKDEALRSLKSAVPRRRQEDYHKTLEAGKVPSPVLKKAPEPAPPAAPSTGKKPNPFIAWGSKQLGKAGEALADAKKKFRDWWEEQSYKETAERIPGVRAVRDIGKDTKELFNKMSDPVKKLFNFGSSGANEGIQRLADPNDRGSYADDYNNRIEGAGQAAQETGSEIARDSIKKHAQ